MKRLLVLALAASPNAAYSSVLTMQDVTITDALGYECIPEASLDLAFRISEKKGVRLPRTCLPAPCENVLTEHELGLLIGRPPNSAEWDDYLDRFVAVCSEGPMPLPLEPPADLAAPGTLFDEYTPFTGYPVYVADDGSPDQYINDGGGYYGNGSGVDFGGWGYGGGYYDCGCEDDDELASTYITKFVNNGDYRQFDGSVRLFDYFNQQVAWRNQIAVAYWEMVNIRVKNVYNAGTSAVPLSASWLFSLTALLSFAVAVFARRKNTVNE